MNRAAIVALLLIVAIVLALSGCVTTSPAVTPISKTPGPQPGVFEFEVGNSLYPKSRGASVGFQRYLTTGEEVTGSFEWEGNDSIRYKWSLYVYAPDGSTTLSWSGANLKHQFHFTSNSPGTYKLEILKRDFQARHARLTIQPVDWDRWGKDSWFHSRRALPRA